MVKLVDTLLGGGSVGLRRASSSLVLGTGTEGFEFFEVLDCPGGEMVDALVSGTSVSDDVKVRVLSWAPFELLSFRT